MRSARFTMSPEHAMKYWPAYSRPIPAIPIGETAVTDLTGSHAEEMVLEAPVLQLAAVNVHIVPSPCCGLTIWSSPPNVHCRLNNMFPFGSSSIYNRIQATGYNSQDFPRNIDSIFTTRNPGMVSNKLIFGASNIAVQSAVTNDALGPGARCSSDFMPAYLRSSVRVLWALAVHPA
jgi:hypothetical protein